LLIAFGERNHIPVRIFERELGHAIPLLLERHHDFDALAERRVRLVDAVDFNEQRQRPADRPVLEGGVFSNGGGWRRLLPLALLTLAATLGGLAFTDAPSAIMVLSGAAGFLVVGSQFVMYALSPQLYPEHVRATGAGGVVSVGRIGSIIGPILAGQLRAAGATPGAVFLALVPAAVVAAIALIGLGRAARDA